MTNVEILQQKGFNFLWIDDYLWMWDVPPEVEDQKELASFLGAKVWNTENGWRIKKEVFPNIFIELIYTALGKLDISYSGETLSKKIDSYHIEFLGIFLINHVLRYITLNNLDKELPNICFIMFSRFFTKQKDWKHNLM